jgi:cell division protein FtsL
MADGGVMRTRGTLRFGLAAAALFAALSLVVWRQSRALEVLRNLDAARAERANLESERASLQQVLQELEGRPHVVAVAAERLGLRPPSASEIVILQLPPQPVEQPRRSGRLAAAGGEW